MEDSKILKKNRDIVTRTIEDETILMPLYRTSEEINCIYTLNDVAARIWELIDNKRPLGRIRKKLLEEFDATDEELDRKLSEFLKDLKEIKAVV